MEGGDEAPGEDADGDVDVRGDYAVPISVNGGSGGCLWCGLHQCHPFEANVRDVEGPDQPLELVGAQFEIPLHTCDARVADI